MIGAPSRQALDTRRGPAYTNGHRTLSLECVIVSPDVWWLTNPEGNAGTLDRSEE